LRQAKPVGGAIASQAIAKAWPAEGYLFGAICPAPGTGAALVMPTVSIEAMNKQLAEISSCVSPGAIALLTLDGAGWHSSPKLIVPENIVLLPLPPYAPELNPPPAENICEYLPQQCPQQPRLRHLRGNPRRLLRRLKRPHGQIRRHHLNRKQRMGTGHDLGRGV
jgi:hypothetical protein